VTRVSAGEAVRVLARDEFPAGACKRVEVAGRAIALFRVGDAAFAIDAVCRHREGPLEEGFLEGFTVYCPWHGWQYDLATGACMSARDRDLAAYRVELRDDGVYVIVPPVL
jgi:nitrite reductase/ring-hydroxylating ferredoxin subunit